MGRRTPQTLPEVLANITDPRRWADFDALVEVMTEVPSVRGMVYGNVAEIEFRERLVGGKAFRWPTRSGTTTTPRRSRTEPSSSRGAVSQSR